MKETTVDALDCLRTRRSVREYTTDPIPTEILEAIVDCGRLAPSGRNEQPWEFVVVTDKERLEELADITDFGKHIARSAACVVVFCKNTKYYLEDGSAATANVCNAAWAHGVASCWVSGDKREYAEDVREALNVPTGYKLISLIPLGYPAETPVKEKRSLSDVIHWEAFGGKRR
jgi:nitroreductase